MQTKKEQIVAECYNEILKLIGEENMPVLMLEFEIPNSQILEHLYRVHDFSKLQISQIYLIYSKYYFALSKLDEVQK